MYSKPYCCTSKLISSRSVCGIQPSIQLKQFVGYAAREPVRAFVRKRVLEVRQRHDPVLVQNSVRVRQLGHCLTA